MNEKQKKYSDLVKIKIALLSDSATQFISKSIKKKSLEYGFDAEIYEPDYGQIESELLVHNSGLNQFKADYTLIVLTSNHLYIEFSKLAYDQKKRFTDMFIEKLGLIIQSLNTSLQTQIIFCNFIEINDSIFGNYANKIESSFLYQIRKINFRLMELASTENNLFICDLQSVALTTPIQVIERKLFINYDIPFSPEFTDVITSNVLDIISAAKGRVVKCVVVDLDNTLWGGIIGDDGLSKIQIGNLGIGKSFTEFQYWLRSLKERGIILAVCSKNEESMAKEPFDKHPDMILKLDDFAIFVANWNSKVDNLRYIQSVLNIGFDSVVFIDDSKFERESVKSALPEIIVPEMPSEPELYLPYLTKLNLFETTSHSDVDNIRTKQYQEEASRAEFKQNFSDYDTYLKSLYMQSRVERFNNHNIPRAAQLTQRSNQFNLRTVRYSESDLSVISGSEDKIGLTFNLFDKFGNSGIIAVIILKLEPKSIFIDTWVMSCRILKRGMEEFIINEIIELANSLGKETIIGEYLPSPKNKMVANLYHDFGFEASDSQFKIEINDFKKLKTFITKA